MGIVAVLIIWYFIAGRNNPKTFKKLKDKKGSIIAALVLISVFSGALPGLLGISIALGSVALPIYIVYKVFQSIFFPHSKEEKKKVQKKRDSVIPKDEQLPNAVPKRYKIVEKFNKKYDLTLTDSQIQTIVESSYVSPDWELFIHSMTKEYSTIHQWYKAPLGDWLRVYVKVFNVQTISSDMEQQKRICIDSFDEIFRSSDLSQYNTPAWDIRKINNKFMTNFDDISFMMAYRFLESNGRKYNLGKVEVLKADEELAGLKNKYDNMNSTGTFGR